MDVDYLVESAFHSFYFYIMINKLLFSRIRLEGRNNIGHIVFKEAF